MEKIKIREFRKGDTNSVYSLISFVMETEFGDIPNNLYLQDINHISDVYGKERDCFYVCEHEGKVIGTIAVKEDDNVTALIRRFFVSPDFRGRGVGSELIAKTLDFCRKNEYQKVFFSGNTKMHRVKQLLQKHGFKEDEAISFSAVSIFKLSYVLD